MSRKLPGSAIVNNSITLTQISGSLNDTTNAAYAQANSARDQANTARSDANTTFATINTTFATLNTSAGTQNTNIGLAYDQANSARGQANTAYGQANSAYSSANLAYAQANAAYGQANAAYGAANTRLSASGGTLSGDLIITGNLTVSGNQTILNTEVLTTEDADIILLSNVAGTPALNAGIIINRGTSTNTFIRWNEVTDKWGYSDDGTTFYSLDDMRSGLVTHNTTFGTVNTNITNTNSNAINAYAQANAAYGQANSAYGAANNRVLKAGDTMTGNLIVSGATVNTATANITTIVTGNALTLSTGTGSNSNVIISANGTEYVRVTNTGFVGIGNTTPSVRMEVSGDARVSGYYRFSGNPSNPSDSTASIYDQSGIGPTISGLSVTFRTGSTPAERMRIESTGNVSIGTTDTSFGGLLVTQTGMSSNLAGVQIYRDTGNYGAMQMNGTNGAYIDFSTPGVDYLGRIIYFTSGNSMQFVTNTAVRVVIDSAGNTGFGITNPNAKIDIVQSGSAGGVANTTGSGLGLTHAVGAGADALALALRTTGSGTNSLTGSAFVAQIISNTTNSNALEMYITGNSPLVFGTSATERMRISGTGNVGIGTTNPGALLQVWGSSRFSQENASWTFDDTINRRLGFIKKGGYYPYLAIASGADFAICHSSNTDLGTSVSGQTLTERFYINSSGNVGIGTTNPTEKLHVEGSIRLNNVLTVNAGFASLNQNAYFSGGWKKYASGYARRVEFGTSGYYYSVSSASGGAAGDNISWTDLLTITDTGSVAIGTTSPQATFDVRGNIFAGNNGADGFIKLRGYNNANASISTNSGVSGNYNGLALNSNENNNNSLSNWIVDIGGIDNIGRSGTGDTFNIARKPSGGSVSTLFLINSSGNVGIGVTNPRVPLDLGSTNNRAQVILLGETGTNNRVGFGLDSATAGMRIFTVNNSSQMIDLGGISTSDGTTWTRNHRFGIAGGNSWLNEQGGNVGIGLTSPGEKLQINDGRIFINGEGCGLIVDAGGSKRIGFFKYSGHEAYISRVSGQDFGIVRLGTSDITSVTGLVHDLYFSNNGAIGVNYTNPAGYGQLTVGWSVTDTANNNGVGISVVPQADTTDAYYQIFFNATGGGIGSIRRVGTTAAVAFNTTSDRRLKENISPANSASTLIDSIQVVQYDWKTGSHIKYGVIAQDLYEVAPEAVSVGDEEETENPRNPWGVDYSKLVPMLIKEIQELRARVNALENP